MKFLVAAAMLGLAFTQDQIREVEDIVIQFPTEEMGRHEERKPSQKEDRETESEDQSQERQHPMLGSEEFNPSPFNPREQQNEKEHTRFPHQRHPGMHGKHGQPPPNFNDYDAWEDHIQSHHPRRHHHRGRFHGWLFGLIFILIGVLLSKCVRRCCKNSRKRDKQFRRRMWKSKQVEEEIHKQEKVLQELKSEYEQKKAREESVARQAMINQVRIRPQPQVYRPYGYYQNIQPQNFYQQGQFMEEIPMGRPINERDNSSFASEYPHL